MKKPEQKKKHGTVLYINKNTRDKRYRKELRGKMKSDMHSVGTMENFAGYVIIGWDDLANPSVAWQATERSPIPGNLLPAYSSSILTRFLTRKDLGDHGSEDE